jgi:hypothetical protein
VRERVVTGAVPTRRVAAFAMRGSRARSARAWIAKYGPVGAMVERRPINAGSALGAARMGADVLSVPIGGGQETYRSGVIP